MRSPAAKVEIFDQNIKSANSLFRDYFRLLSKIGNEALHLIGKAFILGSAVVGIGDSPERLKDEPVHFDDLHILRPQVDLQGVLGFPVEKGDQDSLYFLGAFPIGVVFSFPGDLCRDVLLIEAYRDLDIRGFFYFRAHD